jgi:hypothetical protein
MVEYLKKNCSEQFCSDLLKNMTLSKIQIGNASIEKSEHSSHFDFSEPVYTEHI